MAVLERERGGGGGKGRTSIKLCKIKALGLCDVLMKFCLLLSTLKTAVSPELLT